MNVMKVKITIMLALVGSYSLLVASGMPSNEQKEKELAYRGVSVAIKISIIGDSWADYNYDDNVKNYMQGESYQKMKPWADEFIKYVPFLRKYYQVDGYKGRLFVKGLFDAAFIYYKVGEFDKFVTYMKEALVFVSNDGEKKLWPDLQDKAFEGLFNVASKYKQTNPAEAKGILQFIIQIAQAPGLFKQAKEALQLIPESTSSEMDIVSEDEWIEH